MNDPLQNESAVETTGGFENFGQMDDSGLMSGGGLDGFLVQDDEGKDIGDELFAGTDMASDPLALAGDEMPINDIGDIGDIGDSVNASLEIKDGLELDDSSAIGKWEAEHRSALMDKRNKARAEKEKLLEKAKTDIENFYNERSKKQENIKTQNKENEQNYFTEMSDLMEYGAPWEKVGRLVNLTPKPNEKPGTSKVDRMRRLLIQLKNEKPSQE